MTYYNTGVSGWWGLMGVLALVIFIVGPLLTLGVVAVVKLMARDDVGERKDDGVEPAQFNARA